MEDRQTKVAAAAVVAAAAPAAAPAAGVAAAHLHDGVAVCKEGPVAVAKVEAPDLEVLVGGGADEQ
jgi:hypothetical protein